jgi:hypothetical protein
MTLFDGAIVDQLAKYLFFPVFILGTIENLLLIRFGGNPQRGIKIWSQNLDEAEWQFLLLLNRNILEEKKMRLWVKKRSFIIKEESGVAIRYSNPKQGTSWPMIGYIDLGNADRKIEYRLSVMMLLLLFVLSAIQIYVGIFMSIAFMLSCYMEIIGIRDFLARQTELFLQGKLSQ